MNIKDSSCSQNEFGMNYRVFYPDNYEDLPLLVYLHGAGERGENFSHLYRHGIPKLINEGKEIPAVVLAPQCPAWCVWDNIPDRLKGIIDRVAAEFNIKKDRVCITGSSMGGFGTWMMGKTYPNFFAAIAPVAGGGMSWRCAKLCTTPVIAMHGSEDTTVQPVYSQLMVDGVNRDGGSAELTLLEGYGHNDGIDYAYRNTDLIDKLLGFRRTDFTRIPEVLEGMF